MLEIRNRKPIAPRARKLRLAKTIATLLTFELSPSIQSEKQMSQEVTARSGSRVVAMQLFLRQGEFSCPQHGVESQSFAALGISQLFISSEPLLKERRLLCRTIVVYGSLQAAFLGFSALSVTSRDREHNCEHAFGFLQHRTCNENAGTLVPKLYAAHSSVGEGHLHYDPLHRRHDCPDGPNRSGFIADRNRRPRLRRRGSCSEFLIAI